MEFHSDWLETLYLDVNSNNKHILFELFFMDFAIENELFIENGFGWERGLAKIFIIGPIDFELGI